MPMFELTCEAIPEGEALSVRHASVREVIHAPFQVGVMARTRNSAIDLSTVVGKPARLTIVPSSSDAATFRGRVWSGLCSFMEQAQAEITGESTYFLQIVPRLWLLGHRRYCRIFQQKTHPEIVRAILQEHGVTARWTIDDAAHRKLEYRVQYNEPDLDFVHRMIEEAGITYFFTDESGDTELVFADAPQSRTRRAAPLHFTDNPSRSPPGIDHVTHVTLSEAVASGSYRVRDYDFRNPSFGMMGHAPGQRAPEVELEQYRYLPGYSLVETPSRGGGTPVADDRGVYRGDSDFADERARRALAGIRAQKRHVQYHASAADLAPGVVFTVLDHPHPELQHPLLAVESTLEGAPGSGFTITGRAVLANVPYRPLLSTRKPRVYGPQSAIVVGPGSDEIHVDERGRVRVQFRWDEEHAFDEQSSCWIRVSQSWAGPGYGSMLIPRVGHEVLVGFLDGDPDQPIVVGRVYNETNTIPYDLPQNKAVSTWKSRSTPRDDGFNEIKFDDNAGRELFYIQAERNLRKLVKVNESITVGNNRSASIGAVNSISVGTKHEVTVAQPATPPPTIPPTRFTMIDKKITLTTGEATIEIDGPNILLRANGNIALDADGDISLSAGGSVLVGAKSNVLATAGGGVRLHALNAAVRPSPGAGSGPAGGAIDLLSMTTTDIIALGALQIVTTQTGLLSTVGNLQVASAAEIKVNASGKIVVESSGGDVQILGGPTVKINTR
jgi:type VI secretion system secreted protein VgrG